MESKRRFYYVILLGSLFFSGCKGDDVIPGRLNTIMYKMDGRTVKAGEPFPIALDLSDDRQVDFTLFVELTANSKGDRLYAGMNPIGANLIKSGPPVDENFLSMGLLIAEIPGSLIDFKVDANQQWTTAYGSLVI